MQTDASTTAGSSATLWVSVTGLVSFSGAEVQILVAGDEGFYNGAPLAEAWQFQINEATPCPDNSDNLVVTRGGVFTPNAPICQAAMNHGTNPTEEFYGLWYLWLCAAEVGGGARFPSTRYSVARFDFTLPPASCPGADSRICFWPQLRIGYSADLYPAAYRQPVVAVLDIDNHFDFLHFDPGFEHATANYTGPGIHGCPAPTAARASTWGSLRHLYR